MSRVAWIVLVAAAMACAQEDPFAGGGEHPGGEGGGEAAGGEAGVFEHPDLDTVLGAGLVNRFEGLLDVSGMGRPGVAPLADAAASLHLLPELSEAAGDLLQRYGLTGANIDITDAPIDPQRGLTRPQPPGGPDPGGLWVEPWWLGGMPDPRLVGGPEPVFGRLDPGGQDPDPGGGDPPPQGAPNVPLVPLSDPPRALPRDLRGDGRSATGLALAHLQTLIDQAAADVIANRLARTLDPNARRNRGRSPMELQRRGQLGLALLDLLDGFIVPASRARLLRENGSEVTSLLAEVVRDPEEADGELQQAVERSVRDIVESIRAGVQP